MKKILSILLIFILTCMSVFAIDAEDQQRFIDINENKIKDVTVSPGAIRELNAQAVAAGGSPVLPEEVMTYSDPRIKPLLEDGIGGPITTAAFQAVEAAIITERAAETPEERAARLASAGMSTEEGFQEDCGYDPNNSSISIGSALDNCLSTSDLVTGAGDIDIEVGLKKKITSWTVSLAQLLSLLAIGAIVYGGLLMTLSTGDEEKIKKGKDVVKWAVLGFLGVVLAGALVRIVVEFIFAVAP